MWQLFTELIPDSWKLVQFLEIFINSLHSEYSKRIIYMFRVCIKIEVLRYVVIRHRSWFWNKSASVYKRLTFAHGLGNIISEIMNDEMCSHFYTPDNVCAIIKTGNCKENSLLHIIIWLVSSSPYLQFPTLAFFWDEIYTVFFSSPCPRTWCIQSFMMTRSVVKTPKRNKQTHFTFTLRIILVRK